MENKLNEIDEILASYEDWMHGKDGKNCTKARKLLIEVQKQVKLFCQPDVIKSVCDHKQVNLVRNACKCKKCGKVMETEW